MGIGTKLFAGNGSWATCALFHFAFSLIIIVWLFALEFPMLFWIILFCFRFTNNLSIILKPISIQCDGNYWRMKKVCNFSPNSDNAVGCERIVISFCGWTGFPKKTAFEARCRWPNCPYECENSFLFLEMLFHIILYNKFPEWMI